jgi:hypothetical protein
MSLSRHCSEPCPYKPQLQSVASVILYYELLLISRARILSVQNHNKISSMRIGPLNTLQQHRINQFLPQVFAQRSFPVEGGGSDQETTELVPGQSRPRSW